MSCNEWREVRLGEIVEFYNGKKRPSNKGYIPVFGGNGILDYCDTYNTEGENIIIGRVGAYCGNVNFFKGYCWISDNAILVKSKEGIESEYIYYNLVYKKLNNLHIGSSQPLLTQGILKDIQIYLPPLNEQKAIAKILSDLDEKIEINNRINKILEEIAQAIFKRWFVDFEFPNENGEPYKSSGGEMVDSELGPIPKGWEVLNLDDICELIRDGTHNPPKRISKGIPLLTGTMFDDGIINYEKATFISSEEYKKIHSKYKPEEGDIVITKIGTLGKVALLRKKDIPIAIHCNSALLRANKSKIDSMFLFYLLKSNYFQKELNKRKGQTVQEFINLTSLGQIKVIVPELKKFEKFKYQVRPFFNLFFKLKDENQTLSQLRDTLLPKFMSGEIRVDLNNGEIVMKNNEN